MLVFEIVSKIHKKSFDLQVIVVIFFFSLDFHGFTLLKWCIWRTFGGLCAMLSYFKLQHNI